MNQVIIRDVELEDISDIKAIVCKSWEWEGEFIQSSATLDAALGMYVGQVFNSSTFGKVAVLNDKVVGMIFGSVDGEVPKYRFMRDEGLENTNALLTASKDERENIKEYMSKISYTYQKLIEGKENLYDGCLEFFVVSEEARGLKIGKRLLDEVLTYFKAKKVESFYLYSDETCNYGFYEHNGFSLKETREMACEYSFGEEKVDVFLYDYQCSNE